MVARFYTQRALFTRYQVEKGCPSKEKPRAQRPGVKGFFRDFRPAGGPIADELKVKNLQLKVYL
jgi:hypothetical protein